MAVWARFRDWLGLSDPVLSAASGASVTFSAPKPIDQMFAELYARAGTRVTRTNALTVPAVLKGRNLICSIATLPLKQLDARNHVVRNPLLEQIDPDVANVVTLAQTVEDLLFEATAWWRITAFGFDNYPLSARRLDPDTVTMDPPKGRSPAPLPGGDDPRGKVVWVDGKQVPAREIIRFDSPNPALLKVGGRAIKRALLLDRASELYATDPRALDYFTPADGVDPADDDEIAEILGEWQRSRRQRSTAYVPAALTYNTVDSPSPADLQLVELQRQAGLDIANELGVDPEDLGISTTSRTYSNAVDRRQDRLNTVLAPYMRAVTDRLSMPDVTKRGRVVVFDLDDYLKSNPTERWGTYSTAKGLGVMDVAEIRAKEGLPQRDDLDEVPDPVAQAEAALRGAGHGFAQLGTSHEFTIAADGCEFAVDSDKRTISGLALPYGKVGLKYGLKFRFRRGSLQWSETSRVKHFKDHMTPVGKALELKDTRAGLFVKLSVGQGPTGDELLQLAADEIYDGLSVGVDFSLDPESGDVALAKDGVYDVLRADLREITTTAMPAFDDARVTKVAASRDGGPMDPCATCGQQHAPDVACQTPTPPAGNGQAPAAQSWTAEQLEAAFSAAPHGVLSALIGANTPGAQAATAAANAALERPVVDPTRPVEVTREALPYRFDRGGNFITTEHVFSADLHHMALARDNYGTDTDAGRRVMALLHATFDVDSADINELTPAVNRPDMYVDQQDYRYPIWEAISKGAPPNGIQPFLFPKFSSASGLVGDHTEGTEPTSGTLVTTSQTVTPTAVSGKASITREVWDMGGNPAVSTLIFNQMVRGYREGLESAAATFLNTLTAATDINLGVAVVDDALSSAWDAAVAELQFARGYDFETFVIEKVLYKTFVDARDSTGRVLYPQINPTNANGTAARRFATLDLGGVLGIPSWALASTAGSPNNSWLFDPMFVHGWSTPPQRLEFPGSTQAGAYAPVAFVDLAIWGYKALANSDIGAVRQVIYDSVT